MLTCKQVLTDLKEEIDINPIIARDLNKPLTSVNRHQDMIALLKGFCELAEKWMKPTTQGEARIAPDKKYSSPLDKKYCFLGGPFLQEQNGEGLEVRSFEAPLIWTDLRQYIILSFNFRPYARHTSSNFIIKHSYEISLHHFTDAGSEA